MSARAAALPRGATGAGVPWRAAVWYAALVGPPLVFVVLPMVVLFASSLADEESGAFTLRYYEQVLTTPRYIGKTWNTLSISFATTATSLIAGIPLSFYLWRREFRGKRLLVNLLVIPYMTPHYIIALTIIFLFGSNGAAAFVMRGMLADPDYELPFRVLFTYHGILIVFSFHNLALVVFLMLALLSGIDRSYEEAARSLGASTLTALRRVVLPMSMPAIAGAAVLVFSRAMVDYVVIQTIGGRNYSTLAVEVANRFFGYLSYELAAALAAVLSVMTMALMYGYLYWFRWRSQA